MSEIAWLRFVKKSIPPFFCPLSAHPRIFIPGAGRKAMGDSNAIALLQISTPFSIHTSFLPL